MRTKSSYSQLKIAYLRVMCYYKKTASVDWLNDLRIKNTQKNYEKTAIIYLFVCNIPMSDN
jgi:hypothetical protein